MNEALAHDGVLSVGVLVLVLSRPPACRPTESKENGLEGQGGLELEQVLFA